MRVCSPHGPHLLTHRAGITGLGSLVGRSSGSHLGVSLPPPPGTLGDVWGFVVVMTGGATASSGWGPWMLLSAPQCPGRPPQRMTCPYVTSAERGTCWKDPRGRGQLSVFPPAARCPQRNHLSPCSGCVRVRRLSEPCQELGTNLHTPPTGQAPGSGTPGRGPRGRPLFTSVPQGQCEWQPPQVHTQMNVAKHPPWSIDLLFCGGLIVFPRKICSRPNPWNL